MLETSRDSAHALDGLKVLDIGGSVATGYCGKLFADHGAQVIDIEPPAGAATRSLPPYSDRAEPPENSALHTYLSANKHSIALDISRPKGKQIFLTLAREADVILDSAAPDERIVNPEELAASSPNLVLSAVSWFGQTGPYANFAGGDGVCHALIGMLRGIGPASGPPVMPTGYHAQIVGGLTAYIGTLGQVLAREMGNATGPCVLDTSIFEANLCFTDVGGVAAFNTGMVAPRMGVNRYPPTYPLGIYPCKDGWIGVTALTPSQWKAFCTLLDMEEFAEIAEYQTALGRLADAARLEPIIEQRVATRSAEDLFHRGQSARIPLALVPTMEQLVTVDQYVERGAFAEVSHPDQGSMTAPVTPFRLYRTPAKAGGSAPCLGAHSREHLLGMGPDSRAFDNLVSSGIVVATSAVPA